MFGLVLSTTALNLPTPLRTADSALSRRALGAQVAQVASGLTVLALGQNSATAAEAPSASRMGGLLEPYVVPAQGYKLLKPSGWNKFDADPGNYDVKFQDIIEPFETVQVSTSPVATATSVDALGNLQEVGEKFAKSRNAELVAAKQRDADGSLFYELELKGEIYHEFLGLTINKGKLYRVSCVAKNKRWSAPPPERHPLYSCCCQRHLLFPTHPSSPLEGPSSRAQLQIPACIHVTDKRGELYKNVMLSFVPKGY